MVAVRKLSTLLLAGLFVSACAASVDPDDSDERRGALGKADSVTGSCAESDACGGKAEGCWCDDQCWWYGDCCNDAGEICAVDECNANSGTGCHDGKSCVGGTPNRCLTVSCEPLAAAGVGVCKMLLGYAWNGSECVSLSGCSCAGDGCDSLTDSATCAALHADCEVGSICDAQDAQGEGLCEMFMGYKWDGDKCVGMSGCSCVGADCGALTDLSTCEALHADCIVPQSCGGIVYNPCPEGQFCDYGAHCGSGDQSGMCKTVPEACTTAWAPACGCDGTTYGNTCEAHAESVSVAELGECPAPPPADDSCVDHCGGSSADSSCWCDSLCEGYGDCCADKVAACG